MHVPLIGKLATAALIALVATLVAWAVAQTGFATTVELKTYDWRVQQTARAAVPSAEVIVVSIDDDSIRRMAPIVGRWPWPRLVHASLIDFLERGGARVVVYDVLFSEPDTRRFTIGGDVDADGHTSGGEEWTGAESDRVFADAVRRAGNVVLAADARSEGLLDGSRSPLSADDDVTRPTDTLPGDAGCFERRPELTLPIPSLAQAARGIGHSFLVLDSDGVARRSVPFVRVGGRVVPSLPVAAVMQGQGIPAGEVRVESGALRLGSRIVPLVEQVVPDYYGPAGRACRALIPFRGPIVGEGQTPAFTEYSFYDLFYAENQIVLGRPSPIDPEIFTDRVVVVGASASGTYDVFAVPFGHGAPGAHLHAHVIDALLQGRTIAPAASLPAIAGALLAAALVAVPGAFVTPWLLAGVATLVTAGVVWLSVAWFAQGLWVPLIQPLVAIGLAFVGQLAWHYFVEGREKRQVKRLFSRYVPKNVYDQLLAHPERAALGGTRRVMTVLFSDVRGFTALSERATPEQVVGQLNEYFSRMVDVLFEHRGTLDKFVGDMVMGLFGAPIDDPEHADHAVRAALAMTAALDDLNRQWIAAGRPPLDIGIGISTGEMVAGNIGSDTIMSYTAIGDAVNLGARLESLNKDFGTRVIISDATRLALRGRYDIRPLGEVTVKGKSQPVAIHEVRS
jgi:adenylate cyclase